MRIGLWMLDFVTFTKLLTRQTFSGTLIDLQFQLRSDRKFLNVLQGWFAEPRSQNKLLRQKTPLQSNYMVS